MDASKILIPNFSPKCDISIFLFLKWGSVFPGGTFGSKNVGFLHSPIGSPPTPNTLFIQSTVHKKSTTSLCSFLLLPPRYIPKLCVCIDRITTPKAFCFEWIDSGIKILWTCCSSNKHGGGGGGILRQTGIQGRVKELQCRNRIGGNLNWKLGDWNCIWSGVLCFRIAPAFICPFLLTLHRWGLPYLLEQLKQFNGAIIGEYVTARRRGWMQKKSIWVGVWLATATPPSQTVESTGTQAVLVSRTTAWPWHLLPYPKHLYAEKK